MRKKINTLFGGLTYLGCFFVFISYVLKIFFNDYNSSQFFQGFFIGIGITFIIVGFFRIRKGRKIE